MQEPLRITFRGVTSSEALQQDIRKKLEKLEKLYDRITGCHVTVEMSNHRHHQGNIFHVKIDLFLPGKVIAFHHNPQHNQAHEDIYVALRDAFDTVQRRLEDHVHKLRHPFKHHGFAQETI